MENRTFELLEKMYNEFNERFENMENRFENMENRFENMENRFENMENRFENMENRFENMENRFVNLENKVDKNTLLLEKNNKDIRTIAEVQANHINQNLKQHDEIINKLDSDINILKTAVKSISKDLKFIEHKEFQNEKAIFNMKEDLKIAK